ncbi:MAG: helix-turn-helix domain-containing protein [Thermoanaerobacteraceae bacterium]|nr:helix-turn-helix domain-containing protein [Thermoanaerobacteraceae bacterium]
MDGVKELILTGLVYDIIYSTTSDIKKIWNMMNLAGIEEYPNCVFAFQVDNYEWITANRSEKYKQDLRNSILKALNTYPGEKNHLSAIMGDSLVAHLVTVDYTGAVDARDKCIEMARGIKDWVEEVCVIPMSVGIGRTYRDVRNLNLSYKEALRALNYKFFKGNHQIIHYDDITPSGNDEEIFLTDIESELAAKVRGGDVSGACSVIDILFTASHGTNSTVVKVKAIELFMYVMRIGVENGITPERMVSTTLSYIDDLLKSETATELCETSKRYITEVIDLMRSIKDRQNLKLIDEAIEYIRQNYSEDITLEDISSYIGFSPYYFSHVFKACTGLNFIDYLTRIRIENAKKLLKQENLKISAIAKMVGYKDPNYFSRVFKNVVGIPPSKF